MSELDSICLCLHYLGDPFSGTGHNGDPAGSCTLCSCPAFREDYHGGVR